MTGKLARKQEEKGIYGRLNGRKNYKIAVIKCSEMKFLDDDVDGFLASTSKILIDKSVEHCTVIKDVQIS
jgi:hypothetical protein